MPTLASRKYMYDETTSRRHLMFGNKLSACEVRNEKISPVTRSVHRDAIESVRCMCYPQIGQQKSRRRFSQVLQAGGADALGSGVEKHERDHSMYNQSGVWIPTSASRALLSSRRRDFSELMRCFLIAWHLCLMIGDLLLVVC